MPELSKIYFEYRVIELAEIILEELIIYKISIKHFKIFIFLNEKKRTFSAEGLCSHSSSSSAARRELEGESLKNSNLMFISRKKSRIFGANMKIFHGKN